MKIGERVRDRRQQLKMSQAQLGDAVGVSQQAIMALETGAVERPRYLPELAQVLGVDISDLLRTDNAPTAPRPKEPEAPRLASMPRDVPVLGQAVGGLGDDSADFEFNGQTIDYLRRPPGIAMAREVFGLYVAGTSMWPKYEDGEPIYVSAARAPAIGDYVVVELYPTREGENGAGYVKRLKKRTPTRIVVEQFNPPKDMEFDHKRVRAVYRVIPLVELVGI